MSQQGSATKQSKISSHFLSVLNSKIHYLQQGEGDPIVFVHGMPTSSYLWRNIIPTLSSVANCIAPDLIGMGNSDKPDIDYRVFDHIHYFDSFIEKMKLKNITFVLHGWGSVIGFECARRHEDNIKGLVFYESHIRPTTDWNMLSLPVQQLASLLSRPGASYRAVVQQNYLINKLLPRGVIRPLSEMEMEEYRRPFQTIESRKPLWQYIQDLPLGKGPSDVVSLIQEYSDWLQETSLPKLMFYAIPGFITTVDTVLWAKNHLSNLTLVELEDVLHFAQESAPEVFSEKLLKWYRAISQFS